MRKLVIVGFLFIQLVNLNAQNKKKTYQDEISGQWRTYFQSTFNQGSLKDYAALATGGKIKYEAKLFEKFSFGAALYTSFNLGIQDLTIPDEQTGRISRYEAGLFDVEDLSNRAIAFPGELYVKYTHNKSEFTIGRMKIVSPFLNPQDGRMIPTLEQGIWYSFTNNSIKLQAGIFNEIAPRSTSGFFGIGESIGKYPLGRQLNGTPSLYKGNTNTEWMGTLNLDYQLTKKIQLTIWDYYVENVFNTLHAKSRFTLTDDFSVSLEYLFQNKLANGGNPLDSLAYFQDDFSHLTGIQFKKTINDQQSLSLSYNHIFEGGRFLFPREWGREFLFSFQKRERSEGTANNHAVVAYYENRLKLKNSSLKSIISLGHHFKPSVLNASDNKYALPDYTHLNLDFFYTHQKLPNLKPELLLTYKRGGDDFPDNPNFILNKVDLLIINFIVNYNF